MNFKNWLLFNENIQENFDKWFIDLVKFQTRDDEQNIIRTLCKGPARPVLNAVGTSGKTEGFLTDNILFKTKHKKELDKEELDFLSNFNGTAKEIIKTVLQRKNLETFNWFAFSVGYLTAKPNMFTEDLELAIDVTKRRIDSRELLKQEIGSKGWLVIGYESLEYVSQYLSDQQQISKRKLEKMRKQGLTLDEDPSLIRLIIDENNVKVYFLPAVGDDENIIKKRHLVLCKYGKGTDWCTANPTGSYHVYYKKNNIYTVHFKDKPVYQFVDCNDGNNTQFMDAKDLGVRELEGDIFDVLYKNLSDKLKCYQDVTRLTSIDDLINMDGERLKTIYQQISQGNFEKLINQASKEQRTKIFNNIEKHVGKETVFKLSNLKSVALYMLQNKKIHSLQELADAMLPNMEDNGLNDKSLILEFLNEYRAYIVWRYYSDKNAKARYNVGMVRSNDKDVENDIYKIFGKEKIEEDYPALKIVSPEKYFYYSYGAHNFELKKPNADDKEGSLHSIEHVIVYASGDIIKNIEKIGGPEKLNFENEKMYDIIFKQGEGSERGFLSILNYFKQHGLENKIKELLEKMNIKIFGDIVGYYAENSSYDESLETFKNENFYKILKYIHENKGIDQITKGAEGHGTGMFAIWEYFIDAIKDWSSTGFIRGIFEIVGDKFFDPQEYVGYHLVLMYKLIVDNQKDSKLFNYLESGLPKVDQQSLHYALFDIDQTDDNLELLKFIEVLIKNQPENEEILHLIITYGKLNKELIDKYPKYSKNALIKFGPGIGHINKEGDFEFQQDHLHWSGSIPRENIRYAYKKLLDKDIKKFKTPKYNREAGKWEYQEEEEE